MQPEAQFDMSKILYGLAILFLTVWAVGFFIYGLGMIIHFLLLAAVTAVIIKVIKEH
ncbi:lmo0937 family membrane protein [Aureibaculum sp. 2210JD6-5]|uniref:lmo0937 family membrane protein n=1 Tax=Aureibaculum sp. 2210JD6-5 TaxID=3103957 RepID=UPI002AAE655D|nr:lmo0937 family membrane protein [Aureibaculum sp. 2210JD6-5]MDY7394992.1 lmo0937 family membrane protein [Aureibaculum sp. 2210JD6-5]